MKTLEKELEKSFDLFSSDLHSSFSVSFKSLEGNKSIYLASYNRLSSLEAWRAYVLEGTISPESLDFFIEAQNDALLSHAFARIGSWRAALKSLRSAVENVLFGLFYKDHPVEYMLWEKGKSQLPISEYRSYLERHPLYDSIPDELSGIALLKKEYATLSKAVHGSSTKFRMTTAPYKFPSLMVPEKPKLGQWATREKETLQMINQLMVSMFYEKIQGAKLRDLRKSISFSIPKKLHAKIRSTFGISLFTL
ncbi:MAG: hypothetical protein C4519_24225 [Desulfobacteraceae bacterium]|nr:MAG: hypothetical protein C4519_24225 [Desulfobacteraceae bacterium]